MTIRLASLIALAFSVVSLHAQIYWDATGAGPHAWSSAGNWDNTANPGFAPSATETQQIIFGQAPGTTLSDSFTVEFSADQTLQGGLVFTGYDSSIGRTITLDLNEHNLALQGGTLSWRRSAASFYLANTITFQNGAFQLTDGASIDLGKWNGPVSSAIQTPSNLMRFVSGATFDTTNAANIWVAANSDAFHHRYTLDLSAAALKSGTDANTLRVTGSIGVGAVLTTTTNASSSKDGVLKLGNLSLLEIGQDLIIGQSNENRAIASATATYTGELAFSPTQGSTPVTVNIGRDLRLGVEENSTGTITNAPETLHLNVGTEEARGGNIYVGYKEVVKTISTYVTADTNPVGVFVSNGGTFNAHIQQLRVGVNRNTHTIFAGTATGTLDFAESELGVLDISGDAEIGVGKGAVGTLLLAGGAASSTNLIVGNATETATRSTLGLNETLWSVSSDATVGALGDVNITLENTAAGLEVDGVFSIATGGKVTATFNANVTTESIWALKLAGNQQALLEGYLDLGDGRLVGAGVFGTSATVWQDGGFTYYGLQIPEPSALLLSGLGLAFLFARRKR